jgi:hypothetical protein
MAELVGNYYRDAILLAGEQLGWEKLPNRKKSGKGCRSEFKETNFDLLYGNIMNAPDTVKWGWDKAIRDDRKAKKGKSK